MPHIFHLSPEALVPILIVGYLFIALYIIAPLKVIKRQTKGVQTDYVPIELDDLPPDVSHAFYSGACWLLSDGFQMHGIAGYDVSLTRQNCYMALWTNPKLGDSAQIIGVRTPSVMGIKIVTLVTFRAEFTDGTSIVTSNSPSASCFPPDPKVSSVRCPEIEDIALLYRFHRACVDRDPRRRRTTLERAKDALSRLRLEHEETHGRLINAGYYALDAAGEKYVPTLKGAYMMTYRLLPPFKQIQRMRKDGLMNRTLRETGFGGIKEFRQSQLPMPAPDFMVPFAHKA